MTDHSPRPLFRRAVVLALAALLLTPAAARADRVENELKAAYIYNFIRFVEWPVSASTDAIKVCVVGPLPVKKGLEQELSGRKVGTRSIEVRSAAHPSQAAGCDVLYVASADPNLARRFTAAVPRERVLTITESAGFPGTGSLINLFLEDQTLRFAVNADLLDQTQFKLSSQMLQFGTMVSAKGSSR